MSDFPIITEMELTPEDLEFLKKLHDELKKTRIRLLETHDEFVQYLNSKECNLSPEFIRYMNSMMLQKLDRIEINIEDWETAFENHIAF
jgi:hypothetical protein